MNRREFIGSSLAGLAALSAPALGRSTTLQPKAHIERLADDRFEIVTPRPKTFRILQLTDTHFGRPNDEDRRTDAQTRKMIRALVDEQKPDLIFHTGDFINNDVDGVSHSAIDFMNDLGTPWSLVFGNHDHSGGQPGGLTLDAFYSRLENHVTGFHSVKTPTETKRDYCFRIDIRAPKSAPTLTLIGFNTSGNGPMNVSESQLQWFRSQLESDASQGHKQPIVVMQHIPTVEYRDVVDAKAILGRVGEKVSFEQDKGAAFEMYRASNRVRGVFCGHDHVNDYIGDLKGVRLIYGRVTGWSGYGDWERGGRLIIPTEGPRGFKTWVTLPKGVQEKPEWSQTLGVSQ